jgi:hypothetical protein
LRRTKFGSVSDRRLKPGEWRELKDDEVAALKKAAARPARQESRIGNQESGLDKARGLKSKSSLRRERS